MAGAEAYIRAKFHLDQSNRLATIHQRYRQTGQTDRTAVLELQKNGNGGPAFASRASEKKISGPQGAGKSIVNTGGAGKINS